MHRKCTFLLFLGFALHQATGRCAEPDGLASLPGWKKIQASEGELSVGGPTVSAELFEEDIPGRRSAMLIGNSSVPENYNARRLIVTLGPMPAGKQPRRLGLPFPSQTVKSDPCAIRQPNEIAVTGHSLVVSVHFEHACGSGSGGDGIFTFALIDNELRLRNFEISNASRDGTKAVSIDYVAGVVSSTTDSPDFDKPIVKKTRLPKSVRPPRMQEVSMVKCPPPYAARFLPYCGR